MSSHADHHDGVVAHHFETAEQQKEAATLGMWLFLSTEVMMFGGLFTAYAVFRYWYPEVWVAGSNTLDYKLGAFNTFVLLISSFTMALAVYAAQKGNQRNLIVNLVLTLVFGSIFLGVKYFEYSGKWAHGLVPGAHYGPHAEYLPPGFSEPHHLQIFLFLYFAMTGLHAFHMVIGAVGLLILIGMAAKNRISPQKYMPVELFGYYWHFVDIVWVFLYPLLYLVDLNG